ncbi:hypothetical protein [Actinomadura sp. SCN-SB]
MTTLVMALLIIGVALVTGSGTALIASHRRRGYVGRHRAMW